MSQGSIVLAIFTSFISIASAANDVLASVEPATAAVAKTISFNDWKTQFRKQASQAGIASKTLDEAFVGLKPDPDVIAFDSNQAEFSKPIWTYLETAVSEARLQRGKELLKEHSDLFEQLYQTYGVEPEYLLAIWGVESNYGTHLGNRSVIRSLATLAHDGRRQQFAEQQLLAALKIIDQGNMSVADMKGSWAGAIGHTQFIPTTYEQFAVDFDQDGKRDLVNSIADALGSAANYLAKSGWKSNQVWGQEIHLPDNFDWAMADIKNSMSLGCWQHIGLHQDLKGQPLAGATNNAAILLPAGANGPAWMIYDNFTVIKRYNNANSYALAVAYLGDQIMERSGVIADWPLGDQPISRQDKKRLQAILTNAGFDTQGVDGMIGPNSRAAIRAWQQSMGLPADAYVNQAVFEQLKQQYPAIVSQLLADEAVLTSEDNKPIKE